MAKYIIAFLFTGGMLVFYHVMPHRIFNMALTQYTRNALFVLHEDDGLHVKDTDVLIFSTGKMDVQSVIAKTDSLLASNPKAIGINYCHDFEGNIRLKEYYKNNKTLVICNCQQGSGESSRVIEDHNSVRYFRADRPDYFETRLAGNWPALQYRQNTMEIINFKKRGRDFLFIDLKENGSPAVAESDDIVLIGYMGDYLPVNFYGDPLHEEMYDYTNARITSLNPRLGSGEAIPDMHDIIISANIISTIRNKEFIDEVSLFARVLIMLLFLVINITFLLYVKTRWIALDLFLAMLFLQLLFIAASFLIVWIFTKQIYLNLDELPLILLISTLFTVTSNLVGKKTLLYKA